MAASKWWDVAEYDGPMSVQDPGEPTGGIGAWLADVKRKQRQVAEEARRRQKDMERQRKVAEQRARIQSQLARESAAKAAEWKRDSEESLQNMRAQMTETPSAWARPQAPSVTASPTVSTGTISYPGPIQGPQQPSDPASLMEGYTAPFDIGKWLRTPYQQMRELNASSRDETQQEHERRWNEIFHLKPPQDMRPVITNATLPEPRRTSSRLPEPPDPFMETGGFDLVEQGVLPEQAYKPSTDNASLSALRHNMEQKIPPYRTAMNIFRWGGGVALDWGIQAGNALQVVDDLTRTYPLPGPGDQWTTINDLIGAGIQAGRDSAGNSRKNSGIDTVDLLEFAKSYGSYFGPALELMRESRERPTGPMTQEEHAAWDKVGLLADLEARYGFTAAFSPADPAYPFISKKEEQISRLQYAAATYTSKAWEPFIDGSWSESEAGMTREDWRDAHLVLAAEMGQKANKLLVESPATMLEASRNIGTELLAGVLVPDFFDAAAGILKSLKLTPKLRIAAKVFEEMTMDASEAAPILRTSLAEAQSLIGQQVIETNPIRAFFKNTRQANALQSSDASFRMSALLVGMAETPEDVRTLLLTLKNNPSALVRGIPAHRLSSPTLRALADSSGIVRLGEWLAAPQLQKAFTVLAEIDDNVWLDALPVASHGMSRQLTSLEKAEAMTNLRDIVLSASMRKYGVTVDGIDPNIPMGVSRANVVRSGRNSWRVQFQGPTGTVVHTSGLMTKADADALVKRTRDASAIPKSMMRQIADIQRGALAFSWLNTSPRHWANNGFGGNGSAIIDDGFSWSSTEAMKSYYDRILGGIENPTSRIAEGVGSMKEWVSSANSGPIGKINAAGAYIWGGDYDIPLGFDKSIKPSEASMYRMVHFRNVQDYLKGVVKRIGDSLPPDLANSPQGPVLMAGLKHAALTNGQQGIADYLNAIAKNANVQIKMPMMAPLPNIPPGAKPSFPGSAPGGKRQLPGMPNPGPGFGNPPPPPPTPQTGVRPPTPTGPSPRRGGVQAPGIRRTPGGSPPSPRRGGVQAPGIRRTPRATPPTPIAPPAPPAPHSNGFVDPDGMPPAPLNPMPVQNTVVPSNPAPPPFVLPRDLHHSEDAMSPEAWDAVHELHGRAFSQEEWENGIDEIVAAASESVARDVSVDPTQPGRTSFSQLDGIEDLNEALEEIDALGARLQWSAEEVAQKKQALQQSWEARQAEVAKAHDELREAVSASNNPEAILHAVDVHEDIHDIVGNARGLQWRMVKEAMEEPNQRQAWLAYEQKVNELWERVHQSTMTKLHEAAAIVSGSAEGQARRPRTGRMGQIFEYSNEDLAQMRQYEKQLYDMGSDEFKKKVMAQRLVVDRALAINSFIARKAMDVDTLDELKDMYRVLFLMDAQAAGKRNAINARKRFEIDHMRVNPQEAQESANRALDYIWSELVDAKVSYVNIVSESIATRKLGYGTGTVAAELEDELRAAFELAGTPLDNALAEVNEALRRRAAVAPVAPADAPARPKKVRRDDVREVASRILNIATMTDKGVITDKHLVNWINSNSIVQGEVTRLSDLSDRELAQVYDYIAQQTPVNKAAAPTPAAPTPAAAAKPQHAPGTTLNDVRAAANVAGIATVTKDGNPTERHLVNWINKYAGLDSPITKLRELDEPSRVKVMAALAARPKDPAKVAKAAKEAAAPAPAAPTPAAPAAVAPTPAAKEWPSIDELQQTGLPQRIDTSADALRFLDWLDKHPNITTIRGMKIDRSQGPVRIGGRLVNAEWGLTNNKVLNEWIEKVRSDFRVGGGVEPVAQAAQPAAKAAEKTPRQILRELRDRDRELREQWLALQSGKKLTKAEQEQIRKVEVEIDAIQAQLQDVDPASVRNFDTGKWREFVAVQRDVGHIDQIHKKLANRLTDPKDLDDLFVSASNARYTSPDVFYDISANKNASDELKKKARIAYNKAMSLDEDGNFVQSGIDDFLPPKPTETKEELQAEAERLWSEYREMEGDPTKTQAEVFAKYDEHSAVSGKLYWYELRDDHPEEFARLNAAQAAQAEVTAQPAAPTAVPPDMDRQMLSMQEEDIRKQMRQAGTAYDPATKLHFSIVVHHAASNMRDRASRTLQVTQNGQRVDALIPEAKTIEEVIDLAVKYHNEHWLGKIPELTPDNSWDVVQKWAEGVPSSRAANARAHQSQPPNLYRGRNITAGGPNTHWTAEELSEALANQIDPKVKTKRPFMSDGGRYVDSHNRMPAGTQHLVNEKLAEAGSRKRVRVVQGSEFGPDIPRGGESYRSADIPFVGYEVYEVPAGDLVVPIKDGTYTTRSGRTIQAGAGDDWLIQQALDEGAYTLDMYPEQFKVGAKLENSERRELVRYLFGDNYESLPTYASKSEEILHQAALDPAAKVAEATGVKEAAKAKSLDDMTVDELFAELRNRRSALDSHDANMPIEPLQKGMQPYHDQDMKAWKRKEVELSDSTIAVEREIRRRSKQPSAEELAKTGLPERITSQYEAGKFIEWLAKHPGITDISTIGLVERENDLIRAIGDHETIDAVWAWKNRSNLNGLIDALHRGNPDLSAAQRRAKIRPIETITAERGAARKEYDELWEQYVALGMESKEAKAVYKKAESAAKRVEQLGKELAAAQKQKADDLLKNTTAKSREYKASDELESVRDELRQLRTQMQQTENAIEIRNLEQKVAKLEKKEQDLRNKIGDMRQKRETSQRVAAPVEPAAPAPVHKTGVKGSKVQGWLSPKEKFNLEYEVVEYDDLIPSNYPDGRIHPDYPVDYQPRDRTAAEPVAQTRGIANELDPATMAEVTNAFDRGTPVLGRDNNYVLSGNGRTMAMGLASREKKAAYKQYLIENAEKFGLDPNEVAKMKQPFLIRRHLDDIDPIRFADVANGSSSLRMNAGEVARQRGKYLTSNDLAQIDMGAAQTFQEVIMAARNKPFVTRYMSRLLNNDRAALVDAAGNLSQAGVDEIRSSLFYRVFPGNKDMLERYILNPMPELKNIGNGIDRSLPALARLETGIAEGVIREDLSIADEIAWATDKLLFIRRNNDTVDNFLNQMDMFDAPTEEQIAMLRFLDQNIRNNKTIGDTFKNYVDEAFAQGSNMQGKIAGEGVTTSRMEILNNAIPERKAQGSLLDFLSDESGYINLAKWLNLQQGVNPKKAYHQITSGVSKTNAQSLTTSGIAGYNAGMLGKAWHALRNNAPQAAQPIPPQTAQAFIQWATDNAVPMWRNGVAQAMEAGKRAADFALIDYSNLYGFDNLLSLFVPFHVYQTRTFFNTFKRAAARPDILANYLRAEHAIQRYNERNDQRPRMDGRIPIPGTDGYAIWNILRRGLPYYGVWPRRQWDGDVKTQLNTFEKILSSFELFGFSPMPAMQVAYQVATGRGDEVSAIIPHTNVFATILRANYDLPYLKPNFATRITGLTDEWDADRIVRAVGTLVQEGEIPADMAQWLLDYVAIKTKKVDGPLPEMPEGLHEYWLKAQDRAMGDKNWLVLGNFLTGLGIAHQPASETQIIRDRNQFFGNWYSDENSFGNRGGRTPTPAASVFMNREFFYPGGNETEERPGIQAAENEYWRDYRILRDQLNAGIENLYSGPSAGDYEYTSQREEELRQQFDQQLIELKAKYPSVDTSNISTNLTKTGSHPMEVKQGIFEEFLRWFNSEYPGRPEYPGDNATWAEKAQWRQEMSAWEQARITALQNMLNADTTQQAAAAAGITGATPQSFQTMQESLLPPGNRAGGGSLSAFLRGRTPEQAITEKKASSRTPSEARVKGNRDAARKQTTELESVMLEEFGPDIFVVMGEYPRDGTSEEKSAYIEEHPEILSAWDRWSQIQGNARPFGQTMQDWMTLLFGNEEKIAALFDAMRYGVEVDESGTLVAKKSKDKKGTGKGKGEDPLRAIKNKYYAFGKDMKAKCLFLNSEEGAPLAADFAERFPDNVWWLDCERNSGGSWSGGFSYGGSRRSTDSQPPFVRPEEMDANLWDLRGLPQYRAPENTSRFWIESGDRLKPWNIDAWRAPR